jgi:peroxidase
MHTIWVREHNRIATALSALNPQWGEERLFQEARQIVIAQIQKITYKDYLPLIIGNLSSELNLEYSRSGYNDQSNPGIPNAFATAAYRFGHSQIQPFFDRLDENYNPLPQGPLNLIDAFFTPTRFVESGGTDPILRGLVNKKARFVDEFLNSILTNQLFAANSSAPGLDLASLNIQRGRDHGLPPYLTWKRWALKECLIESEFRNELTKIHLLQTYGTLETVDLFVGGLSEEPVEGGLVGATFACIFARTFGAVRDGDRFYYENANETTGIFTARQRAEIEKASLSRIICDNSDNIQTIQPNAFLANQSRISCSELPQIDLSTWQVPPNKCYIRIGVQDNTLLGRAHTFVALSGFESGALRFHFSQATVSQDEDFECLSIRCPRQSRAVNLAVFPFFSLCSLEQNPNLPSSSGFLPGEYAVTIDSSHVSKSNGVYLDKASCKAGAVNAIDFACGLFKANKQNEDEKLVQSLEQMLHTQQNSGSAPTAPSVDPSTRIDKDVDSDDPLFNDIPEDIRNFFLNRPTPDPSSGGNGKLIAVMENVLEELKAQDNKKESVDDKLVSELSEALSRI